MGNIKINDRDIVVPGETLAEGMDFVPGFGTYRDGENIIAKNLGLSSIRGKVIKLIPLAGRYYPKNGDVIIGRVQDIMLGGWMIGINCAYHSMLSMKEGTSEFIERGADLTQYFKIGDYVVTKVMNVTTQKLVDVTMKGPGLRKLQGGQVFAINSNKVPRVIGKNGSMIQAIKDATGCQITVGQNGFIWLKGEPAKEIIAREAIDIIEKNSHVSGLTEKIKGFLGNQVK